MLALLPLLAAGIDLTRATAACGTQAQTCLEAAGRGWLGPVAVLLVLVYAVAGGLLLARAIRRRTTDTSRPGLLRLWGMGTAGLVAVVGGQELIARAFGDAGTLAGSPLGVLALCVAGGAILAIASRVVADASELIGDLSPRAPRTWARALARVIMGGRRPDPVVGVVRAPARERGPPRRS